MQICYVMVMALSKIRKKLQNTINVQQTTVMLHEGDGIEQDKKGAAHYYEMSADNGDSLGMHEYGKALLTGDGCNENKKAAAKYLQKITSL